MIDPSTLNINDYRSSSKPDPEVVGPPAPEPVPVTCNGCRYAYFQDEGYSNYTVEGTDFTCTLALHPDDGFDRWYGGDQRLEFAQECSGFTKGAPIALDVDHEDEAELTDGQKVLLEVCEVLHRAKRQTAGHSVD